MRRAVGACILLAAAATACGGGSTPAPGTPPAASASSATTSAVPTSAPRPTTRTPSAAPTTTFGYLPLWPFRSVAEATTWQAAAPPGGHQPWHVDADQVALLFTRQYLGFTDVDRVVRHDVAGGDAHVAVGYPTEGGRTGTAAVVHLVRIGTGGDDRPWEVVGTDDAQALTITAPPYGAAVTSPVRVAGHISGVDESIRVSIRQPGSMLGEYCCLGAGGGLEGQPWAVTVRLAPNSRGVVTIVASTGGHLKAVERFAVTGARVR